MPSGERLYFLMPLYLMSIMNFGYSRIKVLLFNIGRDGEIERYIGADGGRRVAVYSYAMPILDELCCL
jgi:hypothetical protein